MLNMEWRMWPDTRKSAALALLAEKPSLLEALLPTRVANDAGAYHVRRCCDG